MDGVLETQDAMRALVSEIQQQAESAGLNPNPDTGAESGTTN